MPTSSARYAWQVALLAAAQTAINDTSVLYCWGEPDHWPDDVVSMGQSTSHQAPATMGTNRSREEILTCELHVISSRTDQQVAADRADQMTRLIEYQCRMVDSTVGGTVRECFLSGDISDGGLLKNDPSGRRVHEIIATFQAKVSVSG